MGDLVELDASQEQRLRAAFRLLNRNMVLMWRLGLGRSMANPSVGYILVLTTTGRKSGQRRRVPLNFAEDEEGISCLAGFGRTTHWLLNLQADPACEVWLPDGRRRVGRGEVVALESRRVELVREILVRSGFAAAVAHPGLDLATATDDEIAGLGPRPDLRYEVVRIELGASIIGPDGPGDLTWIWPATLAATGAVLLGGRLIMRFRKA